MIDSIAAPSRCPGMKWVQWKTSRSLILARHGRQVLAGVGPVRPPQKPARVARLKQDRPQKRPT
jgi:hypothetical protein